MHAGPPSDLPSCPRIESRPDQRAELTLTEEVVDVDLGRVELTLEQAQLAEQHGFAGRRPPVTRRSHRQGDEALVVLSQRARLGDELRIGGVRRMAGRDGPGPSEVDNSSVRAACNRALASPSAGAGCATTASIHERITGSACDGV